MLLQGQSHCPIVCVPLSCRHLLPLKWCFVLQLVRMQLCGVVLFKNQNKKKPQQNQQPTNNPSSTPTFPSNLGRIRGLQLLSVLLLIFSQFTSLAFISTNRSALLQICCLAWTWTKQLKGGADSPSFLVGKREGILVCSGEVTGPDRPWLKGGDKTVSK